MEVIKEKQEEFHQYCERKGGRGAFPALDVVGIELFSCSSVLYEAWNVLHL